jgi:exopolysaccharide biosynthesis polyprenyl glycosylphosphotransferase
MRVFGHFLAPGRARLFLAEQAACGVLFLAALASGGAAGPGTLGVAVASVLALQGALYFASLYDPVEPAADGRWLVAAGLGVLGATAVWAVAGVAMPGLWLAALALALLTTVVLRGVLLEKTRRAVVLGTGEKAVRLARLLREAESVVVPVGYLSDGASAELGAVLPVLLDRAADVDEAARRMGAHLIVLATDLPLPEEALARARADGVEVVSAAGLSARLFRRIPSELLANGELALGEGFRARGLDALARRALDLVAALVVLGLSLPLLLGAMLAVRLDSKGPIFYSQERVGRRGRVFRVTKLRTMRTDAEAAGVPVWAQARDPRITRVGAFLRRTRLDELPQLFAILRGDMSMVGPRPERPFFVQQLREQIPLFGLREAVKPGLTGWAQIQYPYGATIEDARNKLEFDLYYLRHRSVFLDLSVMFHTARTVLTGKGAR